MGLSAGYTGCTVTRQLSCYWSSRLGLVIVLVPLQHHQVSNNSEPRNQEGALQTLQIHELLAIKMVMEIRVIHLFLLHCWGLLVVGYGIIPSRMKGVTAQQATAGEISTFQDAVFGDGFQCIGGAGGVKTAAVCHDRADTELVSPDQ